MEGKISKHPSTAGVLFKDGQDCQIGLTAMLLSPQTFDSCFSLGLNWLIIFDTSWLISDDSHRKCCCPASFWSCRPTFFATWLREGEQVSTRFCGLMKFPVHFRMILAILSRWSSIWCTIDGYCNSLRFLLFDNQFFRMAGHQNSLSLIFWSWLDGFTSFLFGSLASWLFSSTLLVKLLRRGRFSVIWGVDVALPTVPYKESTG